MTEPTPILALTYVLTYTALITSHYVADYWLQTDYMARVKGERGWRGTRACAVHALHHVMVGYVILTVVTWLAHIPLGWNFGAALVIVGVTHYWADRRYTLRWLATRLGKGEYYDHDGAPLLDQAFHHAMIFVAALTAGVLA